MSRQHAVVDGPKPDGFVRGSSGKIRLIRMELHRFHGEIVTHERPQWKQAIRRPKPASAVERARNKVPRIDGRRCRHR